MSEIAKSLRHLKNQTPDQRAASLDNVAELLTEKRDNLNARIRQIEREAKDIRSQCLRETQQRDLDARRSKAPQIFLDMIHHSNMSYDEALAATDKALNLYAGTAAYVIQNALESDRAARLTFRNHEIMLRWNAGEHPSEIAADHDITARQVRNIVTKRTRDYTGFIDMVEKIRRETNH